MNLKWRNLPAFIAFLAGFITCVITIVYRYPLNKMLWVLILVMTVFYILGLIIRGLLNRFVEKKDKEDEEETETDEESSEESDAKPEDGEQGETTEDSED